MTLATHPRIFHRLLLRLGVCAAALGLVNSTSAEPPSAEEDVFLFTSFEEPRNDGLKFLSSTDGLTWQRVPGTFLKPNRGGGQLMRDPCLQRGPDGVFHLVWTTAWRGDLGFGHAHSKDLVHWSPQQFVPVMMHEPTTVNVWAPESFYDARRSRWIIAWASTIPGRHPDNAEPHENNQRMYYCTTQDFVTFTPSEIFCEPGFSVIDATIVPHGDRYILVLKENSRNVMALRTAESDSPTGPWTNISAPFTKKFTEGPSVVKLGEEYLIYFDAYRDHQYGAVATQDFKSFRPVDVKFPAGHKHGTVLRVNQSELDYLNRVGSEQFAGKRLAWDSPTSADTVAERLTEIDRVAWAGPFQPNWESLKKFRTPSWYQDAKFGLFIHWGAYSVPAFGSEWYPRNMYVAGSNEYKHHRETYGDQAKFGYKDFIPQFKAEKFDAAEWLALFKASGAKYIVPVAEHHDGFPMYDSDYTEWSAAKQGPKRDVIGELAEASQPAGITFCASSHRAEHWWFFDHGLLAPSDVADPLHAALYGPASNKRTAESQQEPPDQAFLDDWLLRSCEIVDTYQPLVMYFDWWICQPVFQPYLQRFAAYYYNRGHEWGAEVAINFKQWEGDSYPLGTGVLDIERGQSADIRPDFWQTCTSVSRNSWGHIAGQDYKPVQQIVDDLMDIVSKNGAMLLNIGPKADGTIPPEEVAMLNQIGAWLAINGEAIYGTRPWTKFGEGPTKIAAGSFSDGKTLEYTPDDFRFTTKGNKLYALGLRWPTGGVAKIESLGKSIGKVENVRLLGLDKPVVWRQSETALEVELPATAPNELGYALDIELKGND